MSFAKLGSQHTVNTTVAGDQEKSAAIQLTNGDIVVAWTDRNGSAINVRGQILSSDGVTKEGSEFMLNTALTGDQFDVALTALGNGGFAAGWTSSGNWPSSSNPPFELDPYNDDAYQNHVVTQVFNSAGAKVGAEDTHALFVYDYNFREDYILPEIELDEYLQGSTALTADLRSNSDDFDLIAIDKVHYTDTELFLFTPPIANFNNYEGGENNIVKFSNGDAEILNTRAEDVTYAFNHSVSILIANDPPGYPSLDEFDRPAAITLQNGDVVTAYERHSWEGTATAAWLTKRIKIDFEQASSAVQVGDDYSQNPALAQLTNGNVVAVWQDGSVFDGRSDNISAQIFSSSGNKIGGEFAVDSTSADAADPAIAALTDGRFIVVWQDYGGDGSGTAIKAQVFNEDGEKSGEVFTVNTSTSDDQTAPTVTALANGDAFVTWTDTSGATNDIYSQVLDLQSYVGDVSDETVHGGTLADYLDGGGGTDALYGNGGDDVFESVTQDDLTDGDIMDGGAGIDTLDFDDYVLSWGGPPVLIGDNGTIKGVEVINLHGPTAGAGINSIDIAIPLANNTSNNTLTVNGALAQDFIHADRISNTSVAITLNGGGGDDGLYGGDGGDTLDGGTGADYMEGGSGADTYYVDSTGDTAVENALLISPGVYDTVIASIDYTIGDGIEYLRLSGTADIDGTGNSRNNNIYGNDGSNRIYGLDGQDYLYGYGDADYIYGGTNTDRLYGGNEDDNLYGEDGDDVLVGGLDNDELDGGTGADYMQGGQGDDLYVVDNIGDQVEEYDNQGMDLVLSSITAIAPAYTENLWLTGTANISGIGNFQDNMVVGNSGINTLSGVTGNDALYGLGGADLLWGGAGGDTMDGGTESDTVTYAGSTVGVYADIGANLYFGGDANGDVVTNVENLIGSAQADTLVGDGGVNRLNGGRGVDTLAGGDSDDVYVVDETLEIIIEVSVTGGSDLVFSSATAFTLGANLEKLTFTSELNNTGTGNNLDNVLTGNVGSDILIGNAGDDDLFGKDGVDDLRGGSGADNLDGGEGVDFANYANSLASLTVALDGSLSGTGDAAGDTFTAVEDVRGANIAGGGDTIRGDSGANSLTGNAGDDSLDGRAGADKLIGGSGNDNMTGDLGNDQFIYNATSEGGDAITDFSSFAAGNDDIFKFRGSAFGGLPVGAIAPNQFQSSTLDAAADANVRFFFETDTFILRYDADGSGAGSAAVVIATLQSGANVVVGDISIF